MQIYDNGQRDGGEQSSDFSPQNTVEQGGNPALEGEGLGRRWGGPFEKKGGGTAKNFGPKLLKRAKKEAKVVASAQK